MWRLFSGSFPVIIRLHDEPTPGATPEEVPSPVYAVRLQPHALATLRAYPWKDWWETQHKFYEEEVDADRPGSPPLDESQWVKPAAVTFNEESFRLLEARFQQLSP